MPSTLLADNGIQNCYGFLTPWLDMRGCTFFSLLFRITFGAGLIVPANIARQIQFRMGPTDNPAPLIDIAAAAHYNNLAGGSITLAQTGLTQFFNPAPQGVGSTQTIVMTAGGYNTAGLPGNIVGGADMRIGIYTFNTVPDPYGPNNRFTMAIHANN